MDKIKGVYTALATPFDKDNKVDEEGLRLLIQRQVRHSIDGIVLLGTTGEAPTLSEAEKKQIIKIAREECSGNAILMVGTGSYSTQQTIENTLLAEELGADAALIITPYYNKPTQEGLYQHFKTTAALTSLPIMVYNHGGRTGQNLQTGTLKRLMEISSIIGVKESSGDISQISDVIETAKEIRPDFSVMSGDDALTLPLIALGGDGIISVISNVLPKEIKDLVESIVSEDLKSARAIYFYLMPFIKAAFIETNPIPIKAAMMHYGLPAGHCRLPLCPLSPENALKLEQVIRQYTIKQDEHPCALRAFIEKDAQT